MVMEERLISFSLEETYWIAELIMKCDYLVTYCLDGKILYKNINSFDTPKKSRIVTLEKTGTKRAILLLMFNSSNDQRQSFFDQLLSLGGITLSSFNNRRLYCISKGRLIELYSNSVFGQKFHKLSGEIYTLAIE